MPYFFSEFYIYARNIISKQALNSQTGIAQIVFLILLLAGVGVGTFVVQNRTNIIPHASESCSDDTTYCDGDKKIHKTGGYFDEGSGECVYDFQEVGSCGDEGGGDEGGDDGDSNDSNDNDDDKDDDNDESSNDNYEYKYTECTGDKPGEVRDVYQNSKGDYQTKNVHQQSGVCGDSGGENKEGTKTEGGRSSGDSKCSDDLTYCDNGKAIRKHGGYFDGNTCVYDYYNIPEKDSECSTEKKAKNGDVVKVSDSEEKKYDALRDQQQKERIAASGTACDAITYCENGKKIRKYGTYDPAKKSCNYIFEKTEEACGKTTDGKDMANGTVIGGKDQEVVIAKAKMLSQQEQTANLKSDLNEIKTQVEKLNNPELLAQVEKAQESLDAESAKYDECLKNASDEAARTTCDAAHKLAVQTARSAIFNSMVAGAAGKCVKADFGDSTNLMEVAPGKTAGVNSALFLCRPSDSKDGEKSALVWRVRDQAGELVEPSAESLQKLGIDPSKKINTIEDIPDKVKQSAQKAECLALGGSSCTTVAGSKPEGYDTRGAKAGEAADKAGTNETDPKKAASIKGKAALDAMKQYGGTENEQVAAALSSAMAHLLRKDTNLTAQNAKIQAINQLVTDGVVTRAKMDEQLPKISDASLPTRDSINKESSATSTTKSPVLASSQVDSTWKETNVSLCRNSCKNFPSDAKCLIKQSENKLNCIDPSLMPTTYDSNNPTSQMAFVKAMCSALKNATWDESQKFCKSACAAKTFWVDGQCVNACPSGRTGKSTTQGTFCTGGLALPNVKL